MYCHYIAKQTGGMIKSNVYKISIVSSKGMFVRTYMLQSIIIPTGEDFRNFNGGTITFLPGSTLESATVPIVNDGIAEQTESFTLELQSGTDFDISQGTTEIRIQDDDCKVYRFACYYYVYYVLLFAITTIKRW